MADAGKHLEPGTLVRAYANAVTGPYPTNTIVLMVLAAVAISVGLSVVLGGLVGPGIIILLIIYWAINPPRSVAFTDRGVVLFDRSMFSGKPTRVIVYLPFEAMQSANPKGSYVGLQLGPDYVWVSKKEYAALIAP